MATIASSFERGAQPRSLTAYSLVGILVFAEFGDDLLHDRIAQRREPHQPVGQLPRRHALRGDTHALLQDRRDVEHRQEIARDGEKALAPGGRIGHRADMQVIAWLPMNPDPPVATTVLMVASLIGARPESPCGPIALPRNPPGLRRVPTPIVRRRV